MTGDADGSNLRQLAKFTLALSVKAIETAVNDHLNRRTFTYVMTVRSAACRSYITSAITMMNEL